MAFSLQPIASIGFDAWAALWRGYLTFYETELPQAQYRLTWTRLTQQDGSPHGLAAVDGDGTPLGIVHWLYHVHCWSEAEACYLQDLFTAEAARGKGVATALIDAVAADAKVKGCASIYWMTQDFNARARRLYDQVAVKTPFIKYQKAI